MASNRGKLFEQQFKKSVDKTGIMFERFPDSNKFGQGGNDSIRFTLNSPCDCFMFNPPNLYYLELKSTINTSISFNQPPYEKTKQTIMVKPHQVKSLLERSKYPNVMCGLMLNFEDRQTKTKFIEGGTYFVEINQFVEWCSNVDKKSINQIDCEQIGIKVNRIKKKVNYEYDIKGLIQAIGERFYGG